jgi:transposase
MTFYTQQHKHYCGVDLHARSMYLCVIDHDAQVLLHRNLRAGPGPFLNALEPYRDDLVVGAECVFTWYWLADLCARENIHFVLGHALDMKAVHGAKTKNDRIDSQRIAALLRGGNFPLSYVYPPEMRATRDLLRRRMYFSRKRAELLAHIQNTNSQYNMAPFGRKITYKSNREGVAQEFTDPTVRMSIEANLELIEHYDRILKGLERHILRSAKLHDPNAFYLLSTVHGIGDVLAIVILYEIHDIRRFPRVQNFLSYARLVKCRKESAGKRSGPSKKKIGDPYLKWAFSEAAVLFLKDNPEAQRYMNRLRSKHGKAKALSILAQRLGRAVYYMLLRQKAFDLEKSLRT